VRFPSGGILVSIFIVEDERMICEGLCTCFDWKALGACITGSAADGRTGLENIAALQPDIVLTDVKMPRMNGIDMVQELRTRGWDGEVIFISAYQEMELVKKAFKVRAVDYIFKPIANEELLSVCRTVIQRVEEKQQIREILSRSAQTAWHEAVKSPEPNLSVMQILRGEIYKNIKNITIDSLAAKMGMSRAKLTRTIKQISGETVNGFIVKIRIHIASALLRETNLKVHDIAAQVGFQDNRYFSRLFSRAMGVLPTEYRNLLPRPQAEVPLRDGKYEKEQV
jgi:two-component system response regulator YesN